MSTDVTVFRSGLLHEADMVAAQLDQLGVPHFRRMCNFAGIEMAMPAMAAPGPGDIFSILVPEGASDDAKAVIDDLGFKSEQNCDIWGFRPRPWARHWLRGYAYVTLATFGGFLCWQALQMLSKIFH